MRKEPKIAKESLNGVIKSVLNDLLFGMISFTWLTVMILLLSFIFNSIIYLTIEQILVIAGVLSVAATMMYVIFSMKRKG